MNKYVLRWIGLPALLVLAVTGCADSVLSDPEPAASVVTTTGGTAVCPLTTTMTSDVSAYYREPERTTAMKVMAALSTACAQGDPQRGQHALDLLRGIEYMLDAGRGGDPVVGSRLTNALLACISSATCDPAAVPGLALVGALSTGGLFAVRFGDSALPAIARDLLPFTDFSNRDNAARFGVELAAGWSWTTANRGSPIVLLYGWPLVEGRLNLQETGFGGLQYEFNRWPKAGPFASDDIVHVGVCFTREVELPHDHVTNESSQPRMQREGTLLTGRKPTFCPPPQSLTTASVFSPVSMLTRSLLRSAGFALMSDQRTPAIGGSALDFSRFAPVAANPNGGLNVLTVPPAVVAPNASIGPITVRAAAGGGTAIERVRVTVYISKNRGEPAGAVLTGNPTGFTSESNGTVVIDGLSIGKPGAYTLCVKAELEGFTFQDTCLPKFHIRK